MHGARARLLMTIGLIVAVLGVVGPNPAAPLATAQGGLFSDAGRAMDSNLPPPHPAVVRERLVTVNIPMLDASARAGQGSVLSLNLFDSDGAPYPAVSITASRDRTQPTSSGQGIIWVGKVPGDAASQVTLVTENGVMAGDVRANGRVFHIAYAGNGSHVVYEINPAAFPPDEHLLPGGVSLGGGVGAARAAVAAAVAGQATPARADAKGGTPVPATRAPVAAADDGLTVDFLVVFTAAAAAEAGGQAGMNTQVDLAIAGVNQAYANSAVNFRARLVFKGQVNYSESGSITNDLNAITAGNISNGSQTVASLRNQFGADVVSLITGRDATACGVGWLMNPASASFASNAFNVVAGYLCGTSNFSLAHESGHNMGLCHDWIQNDCTPQVAWGHGYVDPQNRFRDIMSYPGGCDSCPRVQYFSNLVTTYQGNPIGTAHNLPNPADNAGLLNTNASIIANWRQCVVAPCSGQLPTSTPVPGPTNDNFGGIGVASLPASFTQTTGGATLQAGEQVPAGCGSGFDKSVWYSFTPLANMQLIVSTAGSSFDTIVGVWTGSALGGLTQVGCNDDFGGTTTSQVTVNASAGTTYRIQIGGYNGATGTLLLAISGVAATATPTATPIPTPVVNCNPRPQVTVSTAPAGTNTLVVTVMPGANGWINQVGIGAATNARIDIAGQTGVTGNQSFTLPPGTTTFTFMVHHNTTGQATTVPLTVVDTCGSWQTLVGGGASAF